MTFALRDNLHWCDCRGRAVFLDTQSDRYFCLPQAANDAFLRLADRQIKAGDAERLRMLHARGLLIEGGPSASIRPPPTIGIATRDYLEEPVASPSVRDIIRALVSELRIGRMLRSKSFHDVLEGARTEPCRAGQATGTVDRSLREIVSAAAAVAFITRSHDRCLVRALAVYSLCRRAGVGPKLVFGVVAHPFTAHCWVQIRRTVLVGGYEQARLYTPILVIE